MATKRGLSAAAAKAKVATLIAEGYPVVAAMKKVGRSPKTYENWRADDPDFRRLIVGVREQQGIGRRYGIEHKREKLGFAEWRSKFLDRDTYPHQQVWVDLIEGRKPRLRPGEYLEVNDPNRIIINTPPFHAKSATLTVDYVVYRICMNPNIRGIIVSKRQEQADKFLTAVKQRLTSSLYAPLQAAYAPPGGFRPQRGEGKWGAHSFYVTGTTSGEKDPTLEAIGLQTQIYGDRADFILMDDCVVLANAHEFEKQITWLESEVDSRVREGPIVLIGTRLAPRDLYTELRNGDRYLSGRSPWTYLRQPMVLGYAEDPKDWETLWPYSTSPLEVGQDPEPSGLYSAWPGPRAAQLRSRKPAKVWSLVYQQQDVAEDAVFNPTCVYGSVDRRRKPGPLVAGGWGHPRHGLEGQHVIASMDPAMSEDTFTLVGAVNRADKRRRIMQAWVETSPSPTYIRELIRSVTEEYAVNEWVIEQNAFQLFLVYDVEIREFCQSRGVKITPHYTSKNKLDPDFGVASVASLFGSVKRINEGAGRADHQHDHIIDIPDPDKSEGIRSLLEQLITWQPAKRGKDLKQDGPMALWFFELRARDYLGVSTRTVKKRFLDNPYLTRADANRRIVVPQGSLHLLDRNQEWEDAY